MSDIAERCLYLFIGGCIGFMFGYITRALRDIKEELDEVDEIVKHNQSVPPVHDERGVIRFDTVKDAALLLVVLLVAFAAFSSQKASNDSAESQRVLAQTTRAVQQNQKDVTQIAICNQEFLTKTIMALNERTTYTAAQVHSNVELQKAQSVFFSLLLGDPPPVETVRKTAANEYLRALTEFIEVSQKQAGSVSMNPFPTNNALLDCLNSRQKEAK